MKKAACNIPRVLIIQIHNCKQNIILTRRHAKCSTQRHEGTGNIKAQNTQYIWHKKYMARKAHTLPDSARATGMGVK